MKNLIKRYLQICHSKPVELSEKSGLSLATVSRYLSGVRVPDVEGENIIKLSAGLFALMEERTEDNSLSQEKILQELKDSVYAYKEEQNLQLHADNLGKLILFLGISKAKFAEEMFYSPSAMTRILSGDSTPRNLQNFISHASDLVCSKYSNAENFKELQEFLQSETESLPCDIDNARLLIEQWLLVSPDNNLAASGSLLRSIDEFDYETYMSGVDLAAVERIPTTRIKIPITKNYEGQAGMEQGIYEFLKATVTSTSHDPIFVYSDHPIEHLSKDPATIEKWKKAIGAAILQGKGIQILHNMDRPFEEMMIGIESWLPLYMTGNVQSYYSDHPSSHLFNHILMVSGAAVFSGFAAGGAEGHYVFSKNATRIAEGRKNAESLLAESEVLVEAYNQNRIDEFENFLAKYATVQGDRYAFSDSLPLYTMSDSLVDRKLENMQIDESGAELIRENYRNDKNRIASILEHSIFTEIVYAPQEDTNGIYSEHLKLTEEFAANNKNYIFKIADNSIFRNIRIMIHSGKHAIISRNTGSPLFLLVKHPRLVESIELELAALI